EHRPDGIVLVDGRERLAPAMLGEALLLGGVEAARQLVELALGVAAVEHREAEEPDVLDGAACGVVRRHLLLHPVAGNGIVHGCFVSLILAPDEPWPADGIIAESRKPRRDRLLAGRMDREEDRPAGVRRCKGAHW